MYEQSREIYLLVLLSRLPKST